MVAVNCIAHPGAHILRILTGFVSSDVPDASILMPCIDGCKAFPAAAAFVGP
jgi:hypothetical protein